MTIAESIKKARNNEKLTGMQYASRCEKLAVKKHMEGADFKVFTFKDGSTISMYWS